MNTKFTRMFLLLFFLWVLIHSIVITVDGLNDHLQKADCILILGNTVNKDGTLSHRLQARVDKGYELYQKKYASKIIVSGGLGQEGYYEAREMKKYLVSKGIPAQDIIADEQAKTTHETMINYIPIARENNFHSVIVVSQFFHLTRSRAMLHSEGIQNVYDAHADYFEGRDVYAVLREFVAFYGFLLKRIIS